MRNLLLAGAAVAALIAGPAMAADMPVKAPVYRAPPVTVYNWTGCYVGGHAGGLWARKDFTLAPPDVSTPLGGHDVDGWLGGVQGGCDYQAGGVVIGIQGDYAWTDATGTHFDSFEGTNDRTRVRSLATVTGRLGYAWDRFLGYVKGGGAWERDEYDRIVPDTGAVEASGRETRSGLTAGVGGEYAFTDYVSGFAEYNYFDFGSRRVPFFEPTGEFDHNIDVRERKSVVRVGLNIRWGWGPVAAKY
jgi:outer membrane immunogenic protein